MQTTPETVITGDNHAATKGRRCFTGRRINDRGTRGGGCQLTDTSSFDALVGKQFSYDLSLLLPPFQVRCNECSKCARSSRIFYFILFARNFRNFFAKKTCKTYDTIKCIKYLTSKHLKGSWKC